ncbi:hypothetical protein AVEN_21192-1 [Araneus ventricosus]|uniref:Uncharacterized protein n=1 Tax=Araneus ventricosus TaxID=182803 RepID=A0A4Y2MEU2_ARAVE|nr:hypothetical protein AVEN_21192-1 [Araneus ventricosus]
MLLQLINPLSGSVFLVKRFEKRAIEDPLSVLKLRLPPNRICPKRAADSVSSPSELWTVNNTRGGNNHKNSFYSARNLFKLALTAFGDPTCGVTKLTLQVFEMGSWDIFSAYPTCQ